MTLGPDDIEPTPDLPAESADDEPAEPIVEDLDADPDGDGSALCVTICWTPPTEDGTAS